MPKLLPINAVDPFADAPVVWRDEAAGLAAHLGSVFDVLPRLPAKSVHCCVTSPPYWGLRDYSATVPVAPSDDDPFFGG